METKKINQFLNSYSVKMIIVSFLALFLLIPSFLIQEIISERIALSEKVKNELYAQWGGKQVVAGPVLNIPYSYFEQKDDGQGTIERHGIAHFLPETLNTTGDLIPGIRSRNIYKVVVYESRLKLEGSFAQPDISQLDVPDAKFKWDAAYFTIGVSDMRGIKNLPELILNGQPCKVEPGVADNDLFQSGITVKAGTVNLQQPINFSIGIDLNGSADLSVEALGKTSKINMKSSWADPAFIGSFLPEKREVSKDGFTAQWLVTHLNRNFPQQWVGGKFNTHDASLGVELLIPVDHYQKAMRSVKYAILFIALNFIIFIFIEIQSKKRIHPFQYTLVAFALLVFYVLLTSLSEQIGFNPAYLISAVAVTSLISWYAYSILQTRRLVAWVTVLQTSLYIFLFVILQLHDYALLVGSVGLFVILAIIMKVSQKIKWYSEE